MADIDVIAKSRKNQSQGYAFRGIDDMYNELHSHFANHKVFYTSEVINQHREEKQTKSGGTMQYSIINVKFTFYAEDGSNISSTMIGEASDSGDKASNKAMSVALKYALMQLLLIPTEEEKDTEFKSPEFTKVKPAPKPVAKQTETNPTEATNSVIAVIAALPYLNIGTKDFEYARKRLQEGVTLETIKKNFRISIQTERKLLEA